MKYLNDMLMERLETVNDLLEKDPTNTILLKEKERILKKKYSSHQDFKE